jgi:hypothetical protein
MLGFTALDEDFLQPDKMSISATSANAVFLVIINNFLCDYMNLLLLSHLAFDLLIFFSWYLIFNKIIA